MMWSLPWPSSPLSNLRQPLMTTMMVMIDCKPSMARKLAAATISPGPPPPSGFWAATCQRSQPPPGFGRPPAIGLWFGTTRILGSESTIWLWQHWSWSMLLPTIWPGQPPPLGPCSLKLDYHQDKLIETQSLVPGSLSQNSNQLQPTKYN